MTISLYTRDDSGNVQFEGTQDWCSEWAFLGHHDLTEVEPEEERLQGWPHSRVRWYRHPDAPSYAAVGIGG